MKALLFLFFGVAMSDITLVDSHADCCLFLF